MENHDQSGVVQSRLPWLIFAGALIVYVLTLNRWVSLASLPVVATIASRDLAPPLNAPLHFLLTFPFRWLPASWQPIGLNLFAAGCASLTLALLARSVALMPQDRTREQRQRERSEFALLRAPWAWAPPVFATLVCGLQRSFWEHATAGTGEMLDLLLFAYVIRCLLEFRVDESENWLTRAALVYGIAMSNNYAMIGFFPVFIAALIWIKGLSFFEFRFLARMFGWSAAGLTLYLLLPLLNALSDQSGLAFWQALRIELVGQKNILFAVRRLVTFLAGLTSLLPLLLIGIRWPSTFGETSPAGSAITALLFRVVHGAFFAAGIWVAFDGPISARSLVENEILQFMDEPVDYWPFLTFYYLGALCLGYFVGYFLLISGPEPGKTWQRISGMTRLVSRFVTATVWIIVFAIPLALLYNNLPLIRLGNGSVLREFAHLTSQSPLTHGAIALCDRTDIDSPDFRLPPYFLGLLERRPPYLLGLLEASSHEANGSNDTLFADTYLLNYGEYQRVLHERFPARWPAPPPMESPASVFNRAYLMQEVAALSRSNEVYYLHPSFGYYFERLYLQPRGLVYRLALYATNAITPPPLSSELVADNEKFWQRIEPSLERVVHLIEKKMDDARAVGRWYSRALNSWGVDLQKAGRLDEAAKHFELAIKLNPQNVAAEVNLNCNQTLRSGAGKPTRIDKSIEEKFGRYHTWNTLLAINGPVDDPALCLRLGQTFLSQSLFRQSALQFLRATQLEPDNLDARLWLANVFLDGQLPEKTLEVTAEIRARTTLQPLTSTNLIELVRIEAMAHFSKGDVETAEKMLLEARRQHPQNDTILDALSQVYVRANRLTNALATLDEQLKLKPDDALALLNKAYICMKLEAYDQANAAVGAVLRKDPENVQALLDKGAICIQTKSYKDALAPLNQVLQLQPNNQFALMNRAIARLQSDQLDAARHDYEALQKLDPTLYQVYYGLGEIAFKRKDVPTAIKHYEAYLKYAPPDSKEAKQIAERLEQLKASADR